MQTPAPAEYLSIDSPGLELPVRTMLERLSLWLVPVGYLVVGAFGLGVVLAHAFAVGIGAAIVTGVVYRRINNVELLVKVSDH